MGAEKATLELFCFAETTDQTSPAIFMFLGGASLIEPLRSILQKLTKPFSDEVQQGAIVHVEEATPRVVLNLYNVNWEWLNHAVSMKVTPQELTETETRQLSGPLELISLETTWNVKKFTVTLPT